MPLLSQPHGITRVLPRKNPCGMRSGASEVPGRPGRFFFSCFPSEECEDGRRDVEFHKVSIQCQGGEAKLFCLEAKERGKFKLGVELWRSWWLQQEPRKTSAHLSLGFHLDGDHLGSNFSAHLGSNPGWLWMCHTAAAASGMI